MYFYYTGSKQYLAPQGKKEYSLGGYVSSTKVPNSELGKLFQGISLLTIEKGTRSIIGLVLKNETSVDVENLRLYFTRPDDAFCNFEIAVLALTSNSKGEYYMEEIANNESLPYNATFYSADGIGNSKLLGSLPAGGMLGLWLKRSIDKTKISELFTCDALAARTTPLPIEEEIQLNLTWDDDPGDSSSSSV